MTRLDDSIADLLAVDGALGVAVVDLDSGMVLAAGGNPGFDLEIAAAGNSNMLRAKLRTMNELGIGGGLEDMMITLDYQYHLINVLRDGAKLPVRFGTYFWGLGLTDTPTGGTRWVPTKHGAGYEITPELQTILDDRVPVVFSTLLVISVPLLAWIAIFKPF